MRKRQTKSCSRLQRMWIMEKRILEVKHTKKYIIPRGKEVCWKFCSHNNYANIAKLNPKPRNDSLWHDKPNKRIEDTARITKGKLENQALCWTNSKEKSPPTDQQNWRLQKKRTKQKLNPNNNKLQASLLSLQNPTIPHQKK